MPSLFKTTFQIRAASGANAILYFISRLPLIGKHMPESLYSVGQLKTVITAIVAVLRELLGFITKAAYLFGAVLLAAQLLTTGDVLEGGFDGLLPAFAHILFWLSCFFPVLADSQVLKATKDKFIAIKHMRAEPRRYMLVTVPLNMGVFFFEFLPGLVLCVLLAGGGVLDVLKLLLMLVSFRLFGEAFQLWWFKRFGFALLRKGVAAFGSMIVAVAAAYLPVLLEWPLAPAAWLLSLPGCIGMAALGALSGWYVFFGYGYWQRAITRNLKMEYVMPNQKAANVAAFKDVQMREEDLDATPKQGRSLARKQGYAYFNALFFQRHRRMLFRPVLVRLAAVGGCLALLLGLLLVAADLGREVIERIPDFLPIFVFVMYLASVGGKACRAMFYNCDNSMLRYAFYRRPAVILENFNIRLRYVAGYNLLVGAAVCVAVALPTAVAGGRLLSLSMGAFCLSVLLLSVFYSVHHLFLYYVFQPYTTDLSVKNPLFKLINGVVYAVSYACLQIRTAGMVFAFGVLGVTVLYIIVALVLVHRLSPRHFRVK